MDLENFISQTLISINSGIKKANDTIRVNQDSSIPFAIDRTMSKDGTIDFDIAVTASDTIDGSVGGGITVVGINLGSKMGAENFSSTVSRISFRVSPVIMIG